MLALLLAFPTLPLVFTTVVVLLGLCGDFFTFTFVTQTVCAVLSRLLLPFFKRILEHWRLLAFLVDDEATEPDADARIVTRLTLISEFER